MSDRLASSLVTRVVEETLEDVGDRFPIYADPVSGRGHHRRCGGGRADAGRGLRPGRGGLSPGQEDATLYEWPSPGACVDGLPGAVPLLAMAAEHTGNPELGEMAVSYASAMNVLWRRPRTCRTRLRRWRPRPRTGIWPTSRRTG